MAYVKDSNTPVERTINGVDLVRTCIACPQQYDAFIGDEQVGYFRLRHGTFRVDYPDCGGKRIYSAHPDGDGIFYEHEETYYLTEAVNSILNYRNNHHDDT